MLISCEAMQITKMYYALISSIVKQGYNNL